MMQFGSDHSGWPAGSGSGSVTSSPAPPIDAVAQRVDEVVGDDVAAAGDVDEPGVVLHQRQLAGGDDAVGLRRQGEREHDEIGARQGVGVAVGLEHVVDAVEVAGRAAHDGDVAVQRLQQPHERLA